MSVTKPHRSRPVVHPPIDAFENELRRLRDRAYHFAEWAEAVLRLYHQVLPTLNDESSRPMRKLHAWLFVPFTLWPFNVHDVLTDCLALITSGESLNTSHCLLIDLLPEAPDETVCAAVAEHERFVQKGSYENVLKTQAKFAQNELTIRADSELHRQWAQLKAAFDTTPYCDHKGVIRRTMGAERNMRPTFSVNMSRPDDVFRAAFDAFCQRWNLYGMLHDEPLLLKLAVNLTPYGTMILIPSYWSFDPHRDIRWDAIAELHRTRVPGRQGSILAEGKAERQKLAATLRKLDAGAKTLKLKGEKKHLFLCTGLGWVAETSPRRISRLRAEFKK